MSHGDHVADPDTEGAGPNMNFSPVSTTLKCTVSLTIQYMVVFTALGIWRSYLDFRGQSYKESTVQVALEHGAGTVFYAPMACLLFVAFRMRVLQLTKGTGNPQDFAQWGMLGVTYAILANTLLVMLIPMFTAKDIEVEATGEMKLDSGNPFENKALAIGFTVLRYGCFVGLYVGFGCVVYGLFTFTPDPAVWTGEVPPVSPAVWCTTSLAMAFFGIYCLVAISKTYTLFVSGSNGATKFEEVMVAAADTLALAPMFCVLFLGARMRALQMDPLTGNPQGWAQNCFYACTWGLLVQCFVAMFVPLALGKTVKKSNVEGDLEVDMEPGALAWAMCGLRWTIMVGIYVCGAAVVASVFTIEHPDGKELTPPISPTMLCVINLAFQYFTIFFLVWVFYSVKHFSKGSVAAPEWLEDLVQACKTTVQFAPMLSVLFVATRMRALQLTKQQGAPQGYVQDGMYLATWSLMIQCTMCVLMPFVSGKPYKADSLDGKEKATDNSFDNKWGQMIVTAIRYLALVSLLGGVAAVITGVFLMTPENANGRGSMKSVTHIEDIPVVGDVVPEVPAPPKVTDAPGVKTTMEATSETTGAAVDGVVEAPGAAAEASGVALLKK